MKVLYDDCLDAIKNNKCSECNDFYQCSVSEYIEQRYQQGRADADKFLKEWKDDVVNSLCKYDANSVEEVYQYGIAKGTLEMQNYVEKRCVELGIDYTLIFTCSSAK